MPDSEIPGHLRNALGICRLNPPLIVSVPVAGAMFAGHRPDTTWKLSRDGEGVLALHRETEAGNGEQSAKLTSSGQLPPEGTKFSEEDAPAAFCEGGKPGATVLTAPYLEDSPNWLLKGSYLTKHYGPGKELTRHIKVGRAKAYLYAELLVLRDRKAANEDHREESH